MPEPKLFIVTDSSGEETLTPAESKQEILSDLQRMGALEEGTTVELYNPNKEKEPQPIVPANLIAATTEKPEETKVEDIIFTVPGTDTKILKRGEEMFGLKWLTIMKPELLTRLGIEDIKLDDIGEGPIEILDWVPLTQENNS